MPRSHALCSVAATTVGYPCVCVCVVCCRVRGDACSVASTSSMYFDDAGSMCLALPSWKLFPRTTVAFAPSLSSVLLRRIHYRGQFRSVVCSGRHARRNILDKPMPMGTVYTATETPAPQTPSSAGQAFAGSPRTSFCQYWGGHSFLQTTVAVPHAANSIATD